MTAQDWALAPGPTSITFSRALSRSLKVWMRELGMGFVFVVAFTLPHAKSVLTWDSINMTSLRLCILVSSLGGRWNG